MAVDGLLAMTVVSSWKLRADASSARDLCCDRSRPSAAGWRLGGYFDSDVTRTCVLRTCEILKSLRVCWVSFHALQGETVDSPGDGGPELSSVQSNRRHEWRVTFDFELLSLYIVADFF